MTRITSIVGLCALVLVGIASAAPNEPAAKKAQLQVLSTKPLVVRGVGFKARERVRMVATSEARSLSRTKIASRAGLVGIDFGVAFHGCGSFRVKAVGSKGTRVATLSGVTGIETAFPRRPSPDCVAPSTVDR